MTSLPPIFLGEEISRLPKQSFRGSVQRASVSGVFCNDCTQVLSLPFSKIGLKILQKYKERCHDLQNIERFLTRENKNLSREENVSESDEKYSSNSSQELLNISIPQYPLLHQSQFKLQKKNINLENLYEKASKKSNKTCVIGMLTYGPQKKHQKRQAKYFLDKPKTEDSLSKSDLYSRNKHQIHALFAEPDIIVFNTFEVNKTYRKKLKITNVTNNKCTFRIIFKSSSAQFRLDWSHKISCLAAGLSTYLTVVFHCLSLADVEEKLIVTSPNYADLVVYIKATSLPPHLIDINNINCNIWDDSCIISLIDCGSHLVGEEYVIKLSLKNIGPSAKFCFLTEENWHALEFDIEPTNKLTLDSFVLEPMFFSLNKDQIIEISVSGNTPSKDLQIGQVFLLCNNSSLRRIDLIGDGYLFNPAWIQPVGLLKTFDVNIEDDDRAQFYIDFGVMTNSMKKTTTFILTHSGHANISFHWELRYVDIPEKKLLPHGRLGITPDSGRLLAKSKEIFYLCCDTEQLDEGDFRILLILIIDDLPKKCIPVKLLKEQNCDEVLENEVESVEGMLIEVWVECAKPKITLIPYIIDFSFKPLVLHSKKITMDIVVKNDSPGPVSMIWECTKESSIIGIEIEPHTFVCKEFSSRKCTVRAEALGEGTFLVFYNCLTANMDVSVELQVKGVCCKGNVATITDVVDFDLVKKNSQQLAKVTAKNYSNANEIIWTLNELYFNSLEEKNFLESSETLTSLSASEGVFCHKNSTVQVNYQLITKDDTLWCSVLDWSGQYIPVIADIQQLNISLSTNVIFVDPIYVSVKYDFNLTVINHTLLSAGVWWGNPIAQSSHKISIEVIPKHAVLIPGQELPTKISLTALTKGELGNCYIPCFVEGCFQPLLLKIEGNVKGLKVRVEWESETQHCCIVWPTDEHLGTKEDIKYSLSLDSVLCPCPPNSQSHSHYSLGSDYEQHCIVSELSSHNEIMSNCLLSTQPDDTNHDTTPLPSGSVISNESDNISQRTSIPYMFWPIIGGRYTREPMSEEWEAHFQGLFPDENEDNYGNPENSMKYYCESYALCFNNIPVRKAVTQIIYIKNDTMVTSYYEVWVVNNFERPKCQEESSKLEEVERKLKYMVEIDEWYERSNKDRGITVFVEPEKGDLGPQDYVVLNVTVYAFAWGVYTDTIAIQLPDLDLILLKLNVKVNQAPVKVLPSMKFGVLPYKCSKQLRNLKLENTSSVPLFICWQMFSPSLEPLPFGIILFENNPFKLNINPFYGSFGSPYFEVVQSYTFLNPFSTTTIEISFYPQKYNINVAEGVLNETCTATLIGHIYLTNEAKYVSNIENCIRVDGVKLEPLKIEIQASIEIPILTLMNVFNDQLVFKCTAYEVMSSSSKVWCQEKVITVKNQCSTALDAKVSTYGLFFVSNINYLCPEEKATTLLSHLFLQPGELCEITLTCRVTEETLYECFEEDIFMLLEDDIQTGTVEYSKLLFEQEHLTQNVQLELWLYQPLIRLAVSTLNFGLVYIEDTKVLILTLTAVLGKEYFEATIKSGNEDYFSINITSGILQPKIGLPLQVSFSPKAYVTYKDTLVIRSCLDKMAWEIPLSGIGTFNYKSHQY